MADFNEPIPISKIAQSDQCDYEGELCVVIGKSGKNIAKENALEYVGGYVVGNDVSARTWQLDPKYAGGAPQWCFSKSFDKYAPLGPQLVSPAVLTDPSALHLQTRVNGELRQDPYIRFVVQRFRNNCLSFSINNIRTRHSHNDRNTKWCCNGNERDQKYLQDGDEVEVSITQIGTLVNK